jgi:hypothetical protein
VILSDVEEVAVTVMFAGAGGGTVKEWIMMVKLIFQDKD